MRKILLSLVVAAVAATGFFGGRAAWAHCKNIMQKAPETYPAGDCVPPGPVGGGAGTFTKAHLFTLSFQHDEPSVQRTIEAQGRCAYQNPYTQTTLYTCWPSFETESFVDTSDPTVAYFQSPTTPVTSVNTSNGTCNMGTRVTNGENLNCDKYRSTGVPAPN
jgi:hypothetical protein